MLFGSEIITEYLPYAKTALGVLFRVRNGLPLYYTQDKTVFGIMNYSFTAPISIRVKDWSFMFSYTYNIPQIIFWRRTWSYQQRLLLGKHLSLSSFLVHKKLFVLRYCI